VSRPAFGEAFHGARSIVSAGCVSNVVAWWVVRSLILCHGFLLHLVPSWSRNLFMYRFCLSPAGRRIAAKLAGHGFP